MSDDQNTRKVMTVTPEAMTSPMSRRAAVRAGMLGGAALMLPSLLTGCRDEETGVTGPPLAPGRAPHTSMSLGNPPFLGEIRLMSFGFPPSGWIQCNGQLLPINQHMPLFSLLGTVYGGNGQTNFGVPDLRGRTPIHQGDGHVMGEKAGFEVHTVAMSEMPTHTHFLQASTTKANAFIPTGNVLGSANNLYLRDLIVDPDEDPAHAIAPAAPVLYASAGALTPLHPATIYTSGGSQPHENRQPYLVLNYCIAIVGGIFPSHP